jgi:peptide-methionine (S)-S-oxide reductase
MKIAVFIFICVVAAGLAITLTRAHAQKGESIMTTKPTDKPVAVFAGGCFWCTEGEFRRTDGVLFTRVGYTGGTEANPTYEMVSAHTTSHAEAIEVTYDPAKITYADLVDLFLTKVHDPTQLDRQGADVGHQYRSAIFYGSADEKAITERVIARVTAAKVWKAPIVTTLEPLGQFWEAEGYHQQYYEKFEKKFGVPHINEVLRGK